MKIGLLARLKQYLHLAIPPFPSREQRAALHSQIKKIKEERKSFNLVKHQQRRKIDLETAAEKRKIFVLEQFKEIAKI